MKQIPAELTLRPLERQWLVDGFPVLTLRMTLPAFDRHDTRLRRVERCYARFARSYGRYCERFLLPSAADAFRTATAANRPFAPREVCVRCRVTLQTPELLSLTLEMREPDAAAPFLRRRGDTWDLRDGYPLSLSDLFPQEAHPLRRLRRAVRAELLDTERSLRPDWKRRLRTAAKSEHFYLTAAGLVFFYPMYALGGAELGIPEFLFPWAENGPVPPAGLSLPQALDKSLGAALS